MKIEFEKVLRMKITDAENLDPVTVFLDDYEFGRGKITIECYGETWSSYWGAMGDTVRDFFLRADNDYLINCLERGISPVVNCEEGLRDNLKKEIFRRRKDFEIDSDEARELYDMLLNADLSRDIVYENYELMRTLLGDEWYFHDFPTRPNPQYVYLDRIVTAIKEGLEYGGTNDYKR